MKVLYFHQYFSTPKGAAGTRSYETARRLIARGHSVTMVCGMNPLADTGLEAVSNRGVRRGRVEGIDVIELPLAYSNYDSLVKRSVTFFRFAARCIAIAWRERYDLLYATSTPLTAGIPGIVMRFAKPRRKFVFEVRDLWPELPKAMGVVKNPVVLAGMSLLEKASYTAMHAGVALSPGIQDGMRRRSSNSKRILSVPNGCDLDLFRSCTHDSNQEAGVDGFPVGGLRCVFTGAHGLANGLDAVLDAARVLVEKRRNDIHLVFIGDGKLKPRLVERTRCEGLTNCRFLAPLPKDRLSLLMGQTDVGLMILANVPAFYYGTSPNKFFDYIASGLPVVNNYPGWLADMIQQHECGIAVPPDNPEALAAALIRLADDPGMRIRMGQNARRMAETDFDRTVLANRLVDFLESVAAMA